MFPLLARALLILLGATAAPSDPRRPQAPPAETPGLAPAGTGERRRLESLFEGALVGAEDALDFTETPGYRHLLDSLARYGEDELRSKVARELDVGQALASPGDWRGEIVHLRALLVNLEYVRLARPLGENVDAVRALLTKGDGSEGVFVDFLEPAGVDLQRELELERDVVDVEGVFFRTVRYENRKGQLVEAPQLIARGLRRLDTDALPRQTAFDELAKIVIGLAVAYLVVRILLTMRKRPERAAAGASRALQERARRALRPDPPAHGL